VLICQESAPQPELIATQDNLSDRSKSDAFTKIFAILQSTWLIVQCMARFSAGLPITELELATMAYVLCAVMMYGFWWDKPFGAEHVIVVQCSEDDYRGGLWARRSEFSWGQLSDTITVRVDHPVGDRQTPARQTMLYVVATVFSAIHLAAWNWDFPSSATKLLWRVFSVGAVAAGPISLSITPIIDRLLCNWPKLSFMNEVVGKPLVLLLILVLFFYFVCRVGLIVLIFYLFSGMPAGVYERVDWTNYFPHFS
jgi:hypothetical protein